MACCVAVGCSNRASMTDISFYRFPVEFERRNRWISAMRRENWSPSTHSRLCCKHFISGEKSNNPLSPDYVPSVFAHTSSPQKRAGARAAESYERRTSMKKRKYEETKRSTAAAALLNLAETQGEPSTPETPPEPSTPETPPEPSTSDITTDTDRDKTSETSLTMKDIEAMESTTRHLLKTTHELQGKVDDLQLSEESFRVNNDKVKVFTGLTNFNLLLTVLTLIRPNLKDKSLLSPFHQLLLTLMRLRLNVTVQYLSFVFSVHHSTIVRTFSDVIHILNEKFVPLTVAWADRSETRKTLPYIFKQTFPKCVSIIDCFEIFIERPSNLDAKAKTYSNYKSHNTIKYLISMAPQGYVNFISKGWGGRTSDRHLTECCGYLQNLLPGDTVLADRGFTIQDLVGSYGASLEIPAFTKGKAQLDMKAVTETRHLASVRIHIERVIGNIRKKYPILDSTIPITLLQTDESSGFTTLDKIVRAACGLTDICESIVPFH